MEAPEKEEQSFADGFGFEAVFSVAVSALLINIVLIARIKYGQMQITHITTRPYLIAMFLLITLLIEVCTYIILGDIVYKDQWSKLKIKLT